MVSELSLNQIGRMLTSRDNRVREDRREQRWYSGSETAQARVWR